MNLALRPRAAVRAVALSLTLAGTAFAQAAFPGLQSVLTDAEWKRAGLDRLTPDQIGVIDAALIRHQIQTAKAAAVASAAGLPAQPAAPTQEEPPMNSTRRLFFIILFVALGIAGYIVSQAPPVPEEEDQALMGVAMALDATGKMLGLLSSADIRKALLKQLSTTQNSSDLHALHVPAMINQHPICIQEDATVLELLQLIKNSPFAVLYLPVIDHTNALKGLVQFSNLIKSEL
jgi:CBS domain-containing protein